MHVFHSNAKYLFIQVSTNLSRPVNAYEVFAAQLFKQFQITAICNSYVINSQVNAKLFSNPHLQFLQLRASIVVHILVDVHVRYPNLKVLDISHNFENFLLDSMFVPFLEAALFFHPSLQLFVSVNNIKRENSKMLTRRWLKRGETNMDVGMREESDVTLPGLNCRLNVINKFNNHTAREEKCRMVKCLFGLKLLEISYL